MSDRVLGIGIDPDTKNSGIAVVQYSNPLADGLGRYQIVEVALARAKGRLAKDRRVAMSNALWTTLADLEIPYGVAVGVVEWQALRPIGEKRPNNIVDLCGIAGMAITALSRHVSSTTSIIAPTPGDWTGGIPKDVRANRIIGRLQLSSDLKDFADIPPSLRHHAMDAVGLAIWGINLARTGGLPPPLPWV